MASKQHSLRLIDAGSKIRRPPCLRLPKWHPACRRREPRTRARWSSVTVPARSGSARMLAAAPTSWTARLIPTPPIGDIA